MRTNQQKIQQQLEELRFAAAGAWEEARAGVEAAWTDLQDATQRAVDKFK